MLILQRYPTMSQLTSKLYIIRTNKRGHAKTSEASVNENEGCGHFSSKTFGSQNKVYTQMTKVVLD